MQHSISHKTGPALAGLLMIVAVLLTACGSMPAATSSTPAAAIPATGGALVQSANNSKFGMILTTADGRTLYTNTVDTATAIKCVDVTCTGIWKPYTTSAAPTAGQGVTGTLGTATRPDGSKQVTYNQKPLYTFTGDPQPGDANGNGLTDLGGTWQVATVSGAASGGSTGGGSGGGGYYP